MSEEALVKAQDDIITFLMDGIKGRDDFWLNDKFKKNFSDIRGIYPKKVLHMMKDADLIEKVIVNKKVYWRIIEGAYFRMGGNEYEWSYTTPKISKDEIYCETSIEVSDSARVMEEIENEDYPYLSRAKKALEEDVKPKNWLKKINLWKRYGD